MVTHDQMTTIRARAVKVGLKQFYMSLKNNLVPRAFSLAWEKALGMRLPKE